MKRAPFAIALLILNFASHVNAQPQPNRQQLANQVRAEFLHAWNGYKKYCWGHDDLKPLSKTYHDWYDTPLLMTPVDSLDTMILMGLKDEAKATREYIVDQSLVRQRHLRSELRDHDSSARRFAYRLSDDRR